MIEKTYMQDKTETLGQMHVEQRIQSQDLVRVLSQKKFLKMQDLVRVLS